jgi:hypothetical protein
VGTSRGERPSDLSSEVVHHRIRPPAIGDFKVLPVARPGQVEAELRSKEKGISFRKVHACSSTGREDAIFGETKKMTWISRLISSTLNLPVTGSRFRWLCKAAVQSKHIYLPRTSHQRRFLSLSHSLLSLSTHLISYPLDLVSPCRSPPSLWGSLPSLLFLPKWRPSLYAIEGLHSNLRLLDRP